LDYSDLRYKYLPLLLVLSLILISAVYVVSYYLDLAEYRFWSGSLNPFTIIIYLVLIADGILLLLEGYSHTRRYSHGHYDGPAQTITCPNCEATLDDPKSSSCWNCGASIPPNVMAKIKHAHVE
jgi:hypothetical protein